MHYAVHRQTVAEVISYITGWTMKSQW
jgi:hypothetical protein